MANPRRPRRKPKTSGQRRYEKWSKWRPGHREREIGYHNALKHIQRAKRQDERPDPGDQKIVKNYKPETLGQRKDTLKRFGDFLQDAALNIGLTVVPGMLPAKAVKWIGQGTKLAAGAGLGAALGATAKAEKKKGGGQVKKSTGKKRRRAALRGGRSELRGG